MLQKSPHLGFRDSVLLSDLPRCRKMSGGKSLLQRPQQKHRWQSCTACSWNSTAAMGCSWPGWRWRSGEGTINLPLIWNNNTAILSCFQHTVCSVGLEKNKRGRQGWKSGPKVCQTLHTCTPLLSRFQMVKEFHIVLQLQCLQSQGNIFFYFLAHLQIASTEWAFGSDL